MKRDAKIAFLPDYLVANAYTVRMQELLTSFGQIEKLRTKSRALALLRGRRERLDLVIVNWEENTLISRKTRRVSIPGTLKLLLRLAAMKLVARRTVFVRHNHFPHATRRDSIPLARWLVDRYERLFDFVFVHSGAEVASRNGRPRRHYLPHPLYRRVPPSAPKAASPAAESSAVADGLPERYFVTFGRILPYKNIDQLMLQFPVSETLVVCGEVGNSGYAARLAQIDRPNVIYRPGYVSEESAQALVSGAQAVVIAHTDSSTIVSGTFFYALSLQRAVFAVRTPFLEWIAPRLGPDVVTLAEDTQHLCKLVENASCAPLSAESRLRIERELGDEAVRSALAIAFEAPKS